MTQKTFDEAIDVMLSLDFDKASQFVDWYKQQQQPADETAHEFYDDLYGPIAAAHFTNFDEDEEEICGHGFWENIGANTGISCLAELGKIVEETGF